LNKTDQNYKKIKIMVDVRYSEKIVDSNGDEFRSVTIPRHKANSTLYREYCEDKLLSEAEWRAHGIMQSPGWLHFGNYKGLSNNLVLLFRRDNSNHRSQVSPHC
jgi:hypothetical protein